MGLLALLIGVIAGQSSVWIFLHRKYHVPLDVMFCNWLDTFKEEEEKHEL